MIHTLRVHQRCGSVTVSSDPITKMVTIRALYNFVAYIDARQGTIDVYGLGDCGYFELNGKRHMRYVENSLVRTHKGAIFENRMRRTRFTTPAVALRLRAVIQMCLRRVELFGVITLKELSVKCIDASATFELRMGAGARLSSPGIHVSSLRCVMEGGAVVATSAELTEHNRTVWVLNELELILNGPARVSGVYVEKKLMTRMLAGDGVSLDIGMGDDCEVSTHTSAVSVSREELLGREPPRRRYPVMNEHGSIEFVDEEPVPQTVLDASRAAYEEEEQPASATPLFALRGNLELEDEPCAGGATACRICMTNKAVAMMGGCFHVTACVTCVRDMCYQLSTCPVCRAEIGTAVVPYV